MNDKKGGGLMFVNGDSDDVSVVKSDARCSDVLPVEVMGRKIFVILVYIDVTDIDTNGKIYEELDSIVRGKTE